MRKTLLFILLTAVCISLPVSVRSEESTPGKSASIPNIRVSEQNITFGQSITITVEVRNTSVKTSWYWIGLSFCGPLSREWPVGWFDVPAVKTPEIKMLRTCEVTFEFDIPFYMPEGPYDAVSAAWGDYDAENDRMIDRFGERTLKRAFFVTSTGKDKDPYNISQYDSGGLFSSISVGNRYELDDLIRTKNEGVYKSNPVGLLSEEDSNITVMIHGWIGLDLGDNEPFQSSGWKDIRSAYNEKCPPGWSLVEYQWASDADTGLVFRRNQVRDHSRTVPWYTFPKYRGEARAVVASERAYQHGMLLGAKIVEQVGASNLKKVHILCHSAGTWAGYAALRHIRANAPATEVQITYLDPFIPSRTVLYQSHRFNEIVLRRTPSYAMVKTKGAAKCELYYAVDILSTDAFSPATSVDWDWSDVENAEVLRTDGLFSIRWDGHAGPRKFYADSITDPDKDKIKKLGWNISLEKCSEKANTEQNQNADNSKIDGEIMTNHIGMRFKKIPAGSFMMGSPEGEEGRNKNEGPVHKVTISKPFYMGIYEVTQAEYETVTGNNPSWYKGNRLPVETVSWHDAVAYCEKLSEKDTEWEYRLPTEAEWEYCYRAGTKTPFYWGRYFDESSCWYSENSGGSTQTVGGKKPNAWGLYDMAGNVWEWCNDWYGMYPEVDVSDPSGPSKGQYRLLRGGCWGNLSAYYRAAHRGINIPEERGKREYGFRVVAVPKVRD